MKKYLTSLIVSTLFVGCGTSSLQTASQMSKTIFLNPVKKEQRIIFLNIKNTSGQNINLYNKLSSELIRKGYKIVDDPDSAKYILSANILFANNKREVNSPNGMTTGALTGFMATAGAGGKDMLAGIIIGGLIGAIAGSASEDEIFQMVIDINIKERVDDRVYNSTTTAGGQPTVIDNHRAGYTHSFAGPIRDNTTGGSMRDGINENKNQQYTTNYIEKDSRIFAEAVRNRLNLDEAIPILEDKASSQIANIF